MSDLDRHCARLHYQLQDVSIFFNATMHTLGPLSLAPNVFALNCNFIEVACCIFNVVPTRHFAPYCVTNHIAPDKGLKPN